MTVLDVAAALPTTRELDPLLAGGDADEVCSVVCPGSLVDNAGFAGDVDDACVVLGEGSGETPLGSGDVADWLVSVGLLELVVCGSAVAVAMVGVAAALGGACVGCDVVEACCSLGTVAEASAVTVVKAVGGSYNPASSVHVLHAACRLLIPGALISGA